MELIKIQEKNGQQVVSARELHAFLEIKSKFADWIKNRIKDFSFIENQDFVTVSKLLENGGKEIEYALTLEMAKELSMVERNDKGKEARLYFIECERKSKELAIHSYQIEDPIKRAEKWIEEQKAKQLLAQKYENIKIAFDSHMEWISIVKVAQHNNVSETFFDWRILKAKSIQMQIGIKKAQSVRFKYQNLYHVNVFRACYPELNYDIINEAN